jgi:hypothetical protein
VVAERERNPAARVEPEDLPVDARRDLRALYLRWRDGPELRTDIDL